MSRSREFSETVARSSGRLGKACVLAGAVLAVTAAVIPPSARAASPPAAFDGRGFATAIELSVNTKPAMVFSEIIRLSSPFSDSRLTSGGASAARAAGMYPGTLVTQGPAFINAQVLSMITGPFCSAGFPCEFLPAIPTYPLMADAQYPSNPDAKAPVEGQEVVAGPLSFRVLDMRAHAGSEEASSAAVIGDLALLSPGAEASDGVNPSDALIYVRHLQSFTTQTIDTDGALSVEATVRMSGVSLFGDVVRISSIESNSFARSNGDKLVEKNAQVTLGNVTASGQAAEITNQGVTAAGDPIGALRGPVATLFEATGQSIRLIDATNQRVDGTVSSDATGLLVHWELNGSQVPAGTTLVGDIVLGLTSASAYATTAEPTVPVIKDPLSDPIPRIEQPIESAWNPPVTAAWTPAPSTQASAPGTSPDVMQSRPMAMEFLGGIAASRISMLYIACSLAAIGLALMSRKGPLRVTPRRSADGDHRNVSGL
ncbi:MAG: hypothetical protein WDA27_02405 [Actinomycetota bacterium]